MDVVLHASSLPEIRPEDWNPNARVLKMFSPLKLIFLTHNTEYLHENGSLKGISRPILLPAPQECLRIPLLPVSEAAANPTVALPEAETVRNTREAAGKGPGEELGGEGLCCLGEQSWPALRWRDGSRPLGKDPKDKRRPL